MRTIDIVGIVALLAILGFGGYYLMMRTASASPPGSAPPQVPANPGNTPNAPPQPTPGATPGAPKISNEFERDTALGTAGINATKDVLMGGLKAVFG